MKFKICIVVAKYYKDSAKDLLKGATLQLDKYQKNIIEYKIIYTPGTFEIPFSILSNIKKYHGFIALGCVIKGETPHFDFISSTTINAIMNLSINYKKPITNGIVTCLNKVQAIERCLPDKKNKGGEAALALLDLLGITKNKNDAK